MKLTGSQIIIKMLEKEGITTVAGIPGGSILPLYDELNRSSIRHVLVRQEQAAGFIAQGMTRTTGKPAVCMATSGPGAMNLLTAIADARADSIPIIAITGQVNTYLIGTDAFQEADTFGLSFPITKHSIAVKTPEELLTAIPQAFAIAMEGRPGPVLIDVPRDVQLATCEVKSLPDPEDFIVKEEDIRFHTSKEKMQELISATVKMLSAAEKPVLYLGGGCNSQEAAKVLREFKKNYRLPVVSSLMGLGAIPKSDRDFAGMVGMHGSYAANAAMYESDLVIAAGVRFDDRATGVVKKFCPEAKIIHIDIDAAEINKILPASVSMVAKVESVFPLITKALLKEKDAGKFEGERNFWADKIIKTSEETFSVNCGTPAAKDKAKGFEDSTNPRSFMASIVELAEKAGLKEKDLLKDLLNSSIN